MSQSIDNFSKKFMIFSWTTIQNRIIFPFKRVIKKHKDQISKSEDLQDHSMAKMTKSKVIRIRKIGLSVLHLISPLTLTYPMCVFSNIIILIKKNNINLKINQVKLS